MLCLQSIYSAVYVDWFVHCALKCRVHQLLLHTTVVSHSSSSSEHYEGEITSVC